MTVESLNSADTLLADLEQLLIEWNTDATHITAFVFSEITAFPAALLPTESICALCRKHGVMSIVDAAHSLGQMRVDLSQTHCDVWIANGYKWFFAPRSTGLMYVTPALQSIIAPSVVNSLFVEYGAALPISEFAKEFMYTGTRDYVPSIVMADALRWRYGSSESGQSDQPILDYIHSLAVAVSRMAQSKWKTTALVDERNMVGMATLVFPSQNGTVWKQVQMKADANDMFARWDVFNGVFAVRFCAQIFLDLSDFERFVDFVIDELRDTHGLHI